MTNEGVSRFERWVWGNVYKGCHDVTDAIFLRLIFDHPPPSNLLRQKHYGGRGAGGRGFRTKDVLPGGGVFKRDKRDKRDKSIKTGFFAFWKRDK